MSALFEMIVDGVSVKQPAHSEVLGFMRKFNGARDATMFLEDHGIGEAYPKELFGTDFAQQFSLLYITNRSIQHTKAGEAWYQLCAEMLNLADAALAKAGAS